MLIYLTSPKCYNILKQAFPLPSKRSLYNKYGEKIKQTKIDLTDLNRLSYMMSQYRTRYNLTNNEWIPMTLGIDAFSFQCLLASGLKTLKKTTSQSHEIVDDKNEEIGICNELLYNNGFIFLGIPLDYKYPPKILHISIKDNGCYDATIQKKAESILKILSEQGFRFYFKSTDGDKGVSKEHNEFYEKHIYKKSTRFSALCEKIWDWLNEEKERYIPISDPLHFLKNFRSRLIKENIKIATFIDEAGEEYASCDSINTILQLGNAIDDKSSLGKMRDSYVIQLFNMKNIAKLIKAKDYGSAAALFPYACIVFVLFSTSISLQCRLFLIELSFQYFSVLLDQYPLMGEYSISQKKKGDSNLLTIAEEHYVRRILNTLVSFGIALRFSDNRLRLDALGTHLVENLIGIARQTSFDPRWEKILSTFCHADIRKELAHKLEIKLHVQNRVNDGGTKVETITSEQDKNQFFEKPSEWNICEIIQMFQVCCINGTRDMFSESKLQQFANQIDELSKHMDMKEYDVNDAANCSILARLISFKPDSI